MITPIGETGVRKRKTAIQSDDSRFEVKLALPVAEIFRVGVWIAQIVRNQDGGLPGEFETLPALVANGQVVQANHVGARVGEAFLVFFARATRQFLPSGA